MYKTVMILSVGTNWLKASDLRPEPFEETLLQLEKFNENMKQKYRSIGIMDDFSHIVNNMIGSLQEVQVSTYISHLDENIFLSVKRRGYGTKNQDAGEKISRCH